MFLSRDPITAQTRMPNAYTAGNPLQYTDPTGLDFGDWLYDNLTSGPGEVVAKTLVSIGNGATFGATRDIDAAISPGSECYFTQLDGAYRILQDGTSIVTIILTAGVASADVAALGMGDAAVTVGSKVAGQMAGRGWTSTSIQQAIRWGRQVRAVNRATGNPATRYIHPTTGKSVVVDDVTGNVVHVGGPGFKYGPGSGDLP